MQVQSRRAAFACESRAVGAARGSTPPAAAARHVQIEGAAEPDLNLPGANTKRHGPTFEQRAIASRWVDAPTVMQPGADPGENKHASLP